MKRILVIAGLLVLMVLFMGGAVCYSKVVAIENSKGKVPVVIEKSDVVMVDIPELAGEKCVGFKMGTFYSTVGTSISVGKVELGPGGKVPAHESPRVYIIYIVKGEGELGLVDGEGNTVEKVFYAAGDVLVFRPNTLHYWKNGGEETEMFYVEQIPPGT